MFVTAAEHSLEIEAPISSLLTDYVYIEILRTDEQISWTACRSLWVDAGVAVGKQAVMLK